MSKKKYRGKSFDVTLSVDSTGQPFYPPKDGNRFRAIDHNFYTHVPKFNGIEPPWSSEVRVPEPTKESRWYAERFFSGKVIWYRYEYEYE